MAINRVTLLGNVGADPKVYTFENGGKTVSLSLATSTPEYKRKDGTTVPERTEWHNVALFNSLADVAEKYVHKGDKLYIEGELRYRSYEDEAKIKRYVTEIYASRMELLTPKPKTAIPPPPQPTAAPKGVINRTQAAPQQAEQSWNGTVPPNKEEDDLPF